MRSVTFFSSAATCRMPVHASATSPKKAKWNGTHHTIKTLHFVLFHNITCYTNLIVSRIHVNTTNSVISRALWLPQVWYYGVESVTSTHTHEKGEGRHRTESCSEKGRREGEVGVVGGHLIPRRGFCIEHETVVPVALVHGSNCTVLIAHTTTNTNLFYTLQQCVRRDFGAWSSVSICNCFPKPKPVVVIFRFPPDSVDLR